MRLDNRQLYEFFIEKDILFLNHANTVSTSITFIEQNGLLSRGAVERLGLYQTPQSSDKKDKEINVWNDVFLDTIDLHGYYPRQNFYGPVLFKISLKFLLEKNHEVWITKDNPIYWQQDMVDSDKYFVSIAELRRDWNNYERQKKMVTIRNQFEPILFDYLEEVIVDNPNVQIGDTVLFMELAKSIKIATIEKPQLVVKFNTRTCNDKCYCKENYLNSSISDLQRLFLHQNL